MAEFILPIILFSAVLSLISFVSYPNAADKTLRFAASILIIYVSLAPFVSLVGSISDGSLDSFFEELKKEEIEETGEYITVAEEAFKEGICKLLVTKYGVKSENVRIYVFNFDFESMRAEKIKVILSGKDFAADARGMEAWLNTLSLGAFEVNTEL